MYEIVYRLTVNTGGYQGWNIATRLLLFSADSASAIAVEFQADSMRIGHNQIQFGFRVQGDMAIHIPAENVL